MRVWLLDTGPLVAYLDARDPAHEAAVGRLDEFSGRLCTTSAVITEAMHFAAAHPDGPAMLAEFVHASGMLVYECAQPRQLVQGAMLMRKYANIPMDFADATLVLLAQDLKVAQIATLDRRGFSSYRTARGKAFEIM